MLSELDILKKQNAALQKRVDDLEYYLEGMERILGAKDSHEIWPFHLTPAELRFFGILRAAPGRLLTKEHFWHVLYALRHEDEMPEIKIVDVFLCKLRKKLRPHGVDIDTVWGQGYYLSTENAAKLDQIVKVPTLRVNLPKVPAAA
jgi:two-component system cell cycle response regulator CtrA